MKKIQQKPQNKGFYTALFFITFSLILLLFSYLRLKPILFHTIAFTYDQGRDFMKAAEIAVFHNLTFIGPTTGIMGVFHGAWWYYYLTVPFFIFGGSPIGFYYMNFIIHMVSLAVLCYFLYRYFNIYVAVLIGTLIAVSPYFIFTSVFVGNNIMVLPALLTFILTHFILLEKYPKKRQTQIILFVLMGIALGLVSEFEFAFGLLIIPLYIILVLVIPWLRKLFFQHFNFIFFLAGLVFIFIPRLLFEIKNNFSQTRTLFSFILEPKLYTPKPYHDVVTDRLDMFVNFYTYTFEGNIALAGFSLAFVVFLALKLITKKQFIYKKSVVFFTLLLTGLFVFSTFYKDSFWSYYYEGLPYLYIFLLALLFAQDLGKYSYVQKPIYIILIAIIGITGFMSFKKSYQTTPVEEGLIIHEKIVDYILAKEQNKNNICVRVYTPPVIPHTYDYLFFYNNYSQKTPLPTKDWVDNKCWFIIEADSFAERKESWLSGNLPEDGKMISNEVFRDVEVQLWSSN